MGRCSELPPLAHISAVTSLMINHASVGWLSQLRGGEIDTGKTSLKGIADRRTPYGGIDVNLHQSSRQALKPLGRDTQYVRLGEFNPCRRSLLTSQTCWLIGTLFVAIPC